MLDGVDRNYGDMYAGFDVLRKILLPAFLKGERLNNRPAGLIGAAADV